MVLGFNVLDGGEGVNMVLVYCVNEDNAACEDKGFCKMLEWE
ncbi:hypothetical protein [Clostridium chromiireducens]|nr:hypothetical protein [Clostridium chromiireducens]